MDSHRLKLQRAVEHLYAFNAAAQLWVESDAWAVVPECEIATRKHSFRLRVFDPPRDPRLALHLGDCVHTMRHALDHLAYRLAIRVHGADPPPNEEVTGFPITTSRSQFDGSVGTKIGPKKRMPAGLFDLLEQMQPYPGRDQRLWTLHQLDNLDKHRFLPVVAAIAQVPEFNIGTLTVHWMEGPRIGPLEDGEPIFEYVPVADSEEDAGFRIAMTIGFDKASPVAAGELVPYALTSIRELILRRIFPAVEAFL